MTDHLLTLLTPTTPHRLRLILTTQFGGIHSPTSAKAALKQHPEEFMKLYEEMRVLVEKKRKAEMEQGELF